MNAAGNLHTIDGPSYSRWIEAQRIGLEAYFIYLDYLRGKHDDCRHHWPRLKEALNRSPNFFGLPPSVLHFLKLSMSSIPSDVLGESRDTLQSFRTHVRDTFVKLEGRAGDRTAQQDQGQRRS